ncbi:hypothetical protein QQ008_00420 [Fulvivirgaceae bacterium BMA10]|uniref:Uncharacterized protein n=1 Tax=Splendidivirga corallicola TaxID=3051826 RepID=A0ABT8KGF4_9BACT|nr:hypothetical protein [Fulvivirgaceae bacterium BMA10]
MKALIKYSLVLIFGLLIINVSMGQEKVEVEKMVAEKQEKVEKEKKTTNNDNIDRDKINIDFEVKPILFEASSMEMSKGSQPGITMQIPQASVEDVKKQWLKHIQANRKNKAQIAGDEIVLTNTLLTEVSEDSLNIYSKINENMSGTNLVLFLEQNDQFISEELDKAKYEATVKMMRDFGVESYKNAVKDELKEEKKILKDLRNDLNKLQNENEKLHKKISENELGIINKQSDIKLNSLNEESKIEEIYEQSKVVGAAEGEAKKEANKDLKSLKRERKKMQKKNKRMHNKIVDNRGEIEKTKEAIVENLSEQDLQKEKIKKQLSRVKSIEEKLSKIQ